MYTYDYEKTVMDDLLSLEIKLLVEKMLEMQKSYHKEVNLILNQYNKNNAVFKILIEKIKFYRKKMHNLQKLEEKKDIEGNIYNFVGIYHNNNQHEINKINKSEFKLWKNIAFNKDKKSIIYDKEQLKKIFKIIVFDKHHKISGKLNNLENKIIIGLMKKFRYSRNSEIKSNNNIKQNNNKNKSNKNSSVSPIQAYKYMIKNNNTGNNKKKHKKNSSCSQSRQNNVYNFKNLKQK